METLNVDKRSGKIVDVGQQYDKRFFDNIEVPDGTIAQMQRGRTYLFADGAVVPAVLAREIPALFVALDAGVDYTDFHTHPHDQVVFVLHGSVTVDRRTSQARINAGQSAKVDKGTEHKLTGNADATVFITVHL